MLEHSGSPAKGFNPASIPNPGKKVKISVPDYNVPAKRDTLWTYLISLTKHPSLRVQRGNQKRNKIVSSLLSSQ
jgi:hypothetical protein